jgi:hypothetical protein
MPTRTGFIFPLLTIIAKRSPRVGSPPNGRPDTVILREQRGFDQVRRWRVALPMYFSMSQTTLQRSRVRTPDRAARETHLFGWLGR